MKTILVVFLLVLPLVMAATVPYDGLSQEEIEKRMSIGTIIGILKSLDLGPGCVEVCEKHVHGYWRYLCSGACNVKCSNHKQYNWTMSFQKCRVCGRGCCIT